jgi:hypothetical protein
MSSATNMQKQPTSRRRKFTDVDYFALIRQEHARVEFNEDQGISKQLLCLEWSPIGAACALLACCKNGKCMLLTQQPLDSHSRHAETTSSWYCQPAFHISPDPGKLSHSLAGRFSMQHGQSCHCFASQKCEFGNRRRLVNVQHWLLISCDAAPVPLSFAKG